MYKNRLLMTGPDTNNGISIDGSATDSVIILGDNNTVSVTHQSTEQSSAQLTDKGTTTIGPNPYKGLSAFKESDESRYFGREAQIKRLWQCFQDLHEQTKTVKVLLIIGPSGCGKSSLARAGFIPAISRYPLPGKDRMNIVTLVPGENPVKALARVLARAVTNDPLPISKSKEIEQLLKSDNGNGCYEGLLQVASLIPDIRDNPLVILVDQFEEVYSLCTDLHQRQAFIENLLRAAASPVGDVSIIIVLRSDFLGETQQHEQLSQIIGSEQSVIIPGMTEAELRLAITEPAEQAGRAFNPEMVDLLVTDAKESEGVLPLLQFALTRLWEGLKEGRSPIETYREIGRVGGALAGKAQKIYDSLTDAEQKIAQRVFLGLVQVGEGSRDTRRRASITDVTAHGDSPEAVMTVIQRFSSLGSRLITLSSFEGKQCIEVTHEALFEHWQKLKEWIADNRDDIRFQRRLESAVVRWDELNRPTGLLWRQPELNSLHRYHKQHKQDMPALLLKFYDASVQYANRQRFTKYSGISLLSVLAVGMTWFGTKTYQAEQRTLARQTAVEAETLLDQTDSIQQEAGALLAVRASATVDKGLLIPSISPRNEMQSVNQALRRSLTVLSGYEGIVTQTHHERVNAVAFSPDGERILTATEDGIAKLWKSGNGSVIETLSHGSQDVNTAAFSPDGQLLATGGKDGAVRVWHGTTGQELAVFEHIGMVFSVAFSPDGTQIVAGYGDGTARLWHIASGENIVTFKDGDRVHVVRFTPDGQSIVTGNRAGPLQLWDAVSGVELTLPDYGHVSNIVFSPDGKSVVTASDSIVRVQKASSGTTLFAVNHEKSVDAVAFSADSQYVASASLDGKVRVWNASLGEPIATFTHEGGASAVAFSPDGQRIVTAGQDGIARVHWLWSQELSKQVCTQLERNLSASEWIRYIQLDLAQYEPICSNWPVHKSVIEAARDRAEEGEIKTATAILKRALKISAKYNHKIDIDPSTDEFEHDAKAVARRFLAVALVEEARLRSRDGDTQSARELLVQAHSVSPDVDLNNETAEAEYSPEQALRKLTATDMLQEAYFTARDDSIDESIDLFKEALAMNPDIDFNPRTGVLDQNPEKAAKEIAAIARVRRARRLAEEGNVQRATELLTEALSLNPMVDLKEDTEEVEQDPKAVAEIIAAIAEETNTITTTARSPVFSGW